jgi:hypothetical protein
MEVFQEILQETRTTIATLVGSYSEAAIIASYSALSHQAILLGGRPLHATAHAPHVSDQAHQQLFVGQVCQSAAGDEGHLD